MGTRIVFDPPSKGGGSAAPMDDPHRPLTSSTGRRGLGRAACVECRAKKIRCLPGPESGTCQKCHRQQKECLTPQPAPRTKTRKKQLKTRLEGIEKSLENVVSLLHDSSANPPAATHIGTASSIPRVLSPLSSLSAAPYGASDCSFNECADAFDREFLSFDEAEKLCERYRLEYQPQFSYVILPKKLSILRLRHERPLLLQAVLAATTWHDQPLQQFIGERYLKDLSNRFFMEGDISLDMLQSLLVYIAYYHFYMKSPSQKIYSLSCLTVVLLRGLGIDTKLPENSTQHISPQDTLPEDWTAETRRAIIGCYFCSSGIALSYRKVSTLLHNSHITECALWLANMAEEPGDLSMPHIVGLLQITEDLRNTLGPNYPDVQITMSDEKLQLYIKTLEMKLRDVMNNFHSSPIYATTLTSSCHVINIFIREAGIHITSATARSSVLRITILFDCLNTCRAHLDLVRNTSVEEIRPWTFLDWRLLNYTFSTVSKLIIAIDPSLSTPDSVSRITYLDDSLHWATNRLQDAYMVSSAKEGEFEALTHLLSLWKATRTWLAQVVRHSQGRQQQQNILGYNPVLDIQTNTQDTYQPLATDMTTQIGSLPSFQGLEFSDLWTDDDFWSQIT